MCELHVENSCYERDIRNELFRLERRRLLAPVSVPTLQRRTAHSYLSDSGERASRARQRAQPTAGHVIVHHTALIITRPRRMRTETDVL